VSSQRLDEALVARGLSQSRSRARDAILRGTVLVNGVPARKPSQGVFVADDLRVEDQAQHYVSRAAVKLIHALDHFGINVESRYALDIGASTGGFTQVLVERGVKQVTAIEVGHSQMVAELAADSRVFLLEGLNARDLTREHVAEDVTLIVCDVSFIPLKLALPAALSLVETGAELVALIKPQYEVGREFVGRGGMVTDPAQHVRVCEEVSAFLEEQGWDVMGVVASPFDGGDGNAEFLVAARKRQSFTA
jgi:23S rRNA (cytidine1920-2'-O)/16S rRNA (cytidine1409-2'-O)-methyltransferase